MKCYLCPRKCGVDRSGALSFCGVPEELRVSRVSKHFYEEPCISGSRGSGTVFFSGCVLSCVFCQNKPISRQGLGEDISVRRLSELFLELQSSGVHNVNLVTPTQYTAKICEALARVKGELKIPVVWNSGGYESVGTLKQLEGLVDIYLPDLKYAESRLAKSLSAAADYFPRAKNAIREMVRQTGPVQWEGDKIVKGVIIRHLILPGHVDNSLKVLDWIGSSFAPGEVLVSLMRQYTPMGNLPAPLDRRVTDEEYDAVLSWMYLNDLEGFTQEAEAADSVFIPDF